MGLTIACEASPSGVRFCLAAATDCGRLPRHARAAGGWWGRALAEAEQAARAEALSTAQVMGLGAMVLAVLVIANDFTALSVALPAIEQNFDADVTTVQWIITGYALVFGVLIVTGGRLADMFGRRHIFFVGTGIFAAFSALGGFATDAWMLLAARGAMGVGGALMWPAILGMTYALTPAGRAAPAPWCWARPASAMPWARCSAAASRMR
jgi:MFS family permease